jgi:hypothetical protein
MAGEQRARKTFEERVMSTFGVIAGAATAAVVASFVSAPISRASDDGLAMNGTYSATSNGDWAKTNEVFRNEATVRSVWTITTACSDVNDCTGHLTSDAGWTADIYADSGSWYVKHTVENWEPCPDATAAPGQQLYRFYPVNSASQTDAKSTTYAGVDTTTGPSGACGINTVLIITMPFKLVKLS